MLDFNLYLKENERPKNPKPGDIWKTSDGGFIVTGSTYSATKMNEVILIKLDASGNQEF